MCHWGLQTSTLSAAGGPWGHWSCLRVGRGGIGVGTLATVFFGWLSVPLLTLSFPVTTGRVIH